MMRQRQAVRLACGMGVACAIGVLAASRPAWPHSEEAAVSLKTYTPITVDGTLTDWVRRLESGNWTGRIEVQKGKVLEIGRAHV